MFLLVDFLLYLFFSLLDEPFNQSSIVFLSVDHVLLLGEKGLGSELLLSLIHI